MPDLGVLLATVILLICIICVFRPDLFARSSKRTAANPQQPAAHGPSSHVNPNSPRIGISLEIAGTTVDGLKVTGRYESYRQAKQEEQEAEKCRARIRQTLRQRFGQEPSDADVEWGLLNELCMQHTLNKNWPAFRATTCRMANHLSNEGRLKDALANYCAVCFFDANYHQRYADYYRGVETDLQFNPEFGFQLDAVAQVLELTKRLGLNVGGLKSVFIEHNRQLRNVLTPFGPATLSPENCWALLEKKLRGDLITEPPGYYKGRHYTAHVEEVKALKRVGDLDRAAELLLHLIEATEAEAKATGEVIAPWYYEQLAVVYRKQKAFDKETEVLQRCIDRLQTAGGHPEQLLERLNKAKQKMESS